MDKPFLTVAEAAEHLSVSPFTIRDWLRAGTLRSVRLGTKRCIRIQRGDLSRFISCRSRGGEDDAL
ncbi:helix-turn-helix domain-containing protein [Terriglobus sp. RCC_193]|uniref:helix-turn-helix domain-containing protein n=1 Tax=Terriglobus sp. RCC_193 TaxID=3239218 RepID=UPI003523D5B6